MLVIIVVTISTCFVSFMLFITNLGQNFSPGTGHHAERDPGLFDPGSIFFRDLESPPPRILLLTCRFLRESVSEFERELEFAHSSLSPKEYGQGKKSCERRLPVERAGI